MVDRRDIFPKVMIGYLACNFALVLFDYFLTDQIPSVSLSDDNSAGNEIFRSIVAAAIWIPYLLKSERVKQTFTKPYNTINGIISPVNEIDETAEVIVSSDNDSEKSIL